MINRYLLIVNWAWFIHHFKLRAESNPPLITSNCLVPGDSMMNWFIIRMACTSLYGLMSSAKSLVLVSVRFVFRGYLGYGLSTVAASCLLVAIPKHQSCCQLVRSPYTAGWLYPRFVGPVLISWLAVTCTVVDVFWSNPKSTMTPHLSFTRAQPVAEQAPPCRFRSSSDMPRAFQMGKWMVGWWWSNTIVSR